MDNKHYQLNATENAPELSTLSAEGYPTNGTPSLGIPPTQPGAAWFHAVASELHNAITAGGETPSATKIDQLATVLNKMVRLTGNQTISGTKTFSAVTKSATPSASATGTEVVTAAWLRSRMSELLPAGTIVPFAGSNIPSGFLLCNGAKVSRTTYATLFSAIGTTWGTGDGSTTFTLPDARDRFLEGANTNALGTYLEAGLPNITGTFGYGSNGFATYASGAFNLWQKVTNANAQQNNTGYTRVEFYASNASAVYSNSTTVQPNALNVQYLIKY